MTEMFEKSESIKEIAKALGGFNADVGKVAKTADNPFFHSKYAPLDAVIEAIKAPLKEHGLSFSQLPCGDGLTTILMHTSGEYLAATAKLELKDTNPQQQGSAITYMRRYALSAALGLATEDDNDGNGPPAAPKGEAKTAAKQKAAPSGAKPQPKAPTEQDICRDRLLSHFKGAAGEAKKFMQEVTGKAASKDLTDDDIKLIDIALTNEQMNDEAKE